MKGFLSALLGAVTWVIGIGAGIFLAYLIIAGIFLGLVAIFGTSPTAPSPAPVLAEQSCPDWFVTPDYWRGLASSEWHFLDLMSPCWRRGRADAMGHGDTTCAPGSSPAPHGGCCRDGTHENETNASKCAPNGWHSVGDYYCRDGWHGIGNNQCAQN